MKSARALAQHFSWRSLRQAANQKRSDLFNPGPLSIRVIQNSVRAVCVCNQARTVHHQRLLSTPPPSLVFESSFELGWLPRARQVKLCHLKIGLRLDT